MLTPGDSCEGTSAAAASLVVCDSGIPFGQEVEEKGDEKHWKEEELLVDERIPQVSGRRDRHSTPLYPRRSWCSDRGR